MICTKRVAREIARTVSHAQTAVTAAAEAGRPRPPRRCDPGVVDVEPPNWEDL